MEEKKTIKMSLSTFFLILAIIVIIVMAYFVYKFYNEKNIETEKVSDLNNQVSSLETTVTDLQCKIDNIINTLNSDNTQQNTNIENSSSNHETLEMPNIKFKTGYYTYEYTETYNDYSGKYNLDLSMGYNFEEDGSVNAFLPGHESGDLEGNYTVLDDGTINCVFTKFNNECSGTYGIKLDSEGEVNLKMVSDTTIKSIKWINTPKLYNKDLSFGNDITFTLSSN